MRKYHINQTISDLNGIAIKFRKMVNYRNSVIVVQF